MTAAATEYVSLLDVTREQARITQLVGTGLVLSEIGERVAAKVTGSIRVSGAGRDLLASPPQGWTRPANPYGIENGNRRRVAPEMVGEVKVRQLAPALGREQMIDLRGAGPASPLYPLADFWFVIIFDTDGDIALARQLTLHEVLSYALRSGVAGGWNYKVAVSLDLAAGADLTQQARLALRQLAPDVGGRPRRTHAYLR